VAIHHVSRSDRRRQRADPAACFGIERYLGDEITAEKPGEPRLATTAPPNLSDHCRTGRERRHFSIGQQHVSANAGQAPIERNQGPGIEDDVSHAARRDPGRLRRPLIAFRTSPRGSPSERAIDATTSAGVGSRRSSSSKSATRSARARAFARIASAIQALTDGARPALTSASAKRARSSSRLTVIRRIHGAYSCMHSAATAGIGDGVPRPLAAKSTGTSPTTALP
jgi:hypothetical protein